MASGSVFCFQVCLWFSQRHTRLCTSIYTNYCVRHLYGACVYESNFSLAYTFHDDAHVIHVITIPSGDILNEDLLNDDTTAVITDGDSFHSEVVDVIIDDNMLTKSMAQADDPDVEIVVGRASESLDFSYASSIMLGAYCVANAPPRVLDKGNKVKALHHERSDIIGVQHKEQVVSHREEEGINKHYVNSKIDDWLHMLFSIKLVEYTHNAKSPLLCIIEGQPISILTTQGVSLHVLDKVGTYILESGSLIHRFLQLESVVGHSGTKVAKQDCALQSNNSSLVFPISCAAVESGDNLIDSGQREQSPGSVENNGKSPSLLQRHTVMGGNIHTVRVFTHCKDINVSSFQDIVIPGSQKSPIVLLPMCDNAFTAPDSGFGQGILSFVSRLLLP